MGKRVESLSAADFHWPEERSPVRFRIFEGRHTQSLRGVPETKKRTLSLLIQASSSPQGMLKIAKVMKTRNGIRVAMKDNERNLPFMAFDRGAWHRRFPSGGMTGRLEEF